MSVKMSEHPFHALFQTFSKVSNSIQTQLYNLIAQPHKPSPTAQKSLLSASSSSSSRVVAWSDNGSADHPESKDILSTKKVKSAAPLTKEELGRSTWTFLHTLAAQYPDKPTRQQKKDVKELMSILSRMYPCKECADHFQEILRFTISSFTHHLRSSLVSRSSQLRHRVISYQISKYQILYRLDHMPSSPNGYVMCIIRLTEALTNRFSPVNELMHGGAS
ncbi:FAD-linked sulfhydryl oxidase ERV1 isoform X1 [Malus domestica]|uniref:FAD-linked sulfhydryl oxidase ERV1 isoform X1 n=1 Tax=Malus domestica TaxID=3750 RepID=UPI0004986F00